MLGAMNGTVTARSRRARQRALLDWYAKEARHLPWRETTDPYRIWISEIMLQQTRVETVLRYYEPFLRRFPSIGVLADAELEAVLKAWEGMGYYRRARNLSRASRYSIKRYAGFPPSYEEFLSLPGVGAYTAAAVWAIAFGEARLPLDGNIRRVLSRLYDLDTLRDRAYHEVGQPLMERLEPRQVSPMAQALMELGALICQPRDPQCPVCPIRRTCRARISGTIDARPPRRPKREIPHYEVAVAYLANDEGRVLLAKRRAEAFLGGMWELPGGKVKDGETLEEAIRRELNEELGIRRVRRLRHVGRVRHAYTHFKVTLQLFEAETVERPRIHEGPVAIRWVKPRHIRDYPLPRGTQKALELRDHTT